MGGVCRLVVERSEVDAPACTDNFQIVSPAFSVNGHAFHSAEQAYQASKFPVDSLAFKRIADADPRGKTDEDFGMEVWRIGNNARPIENWPEIKVKSMYVVNLCKFIENKSLAGVLASTVGSIEAAPSTWRWQFFNSQIMTKIRDLLINGNLKTELERVTAIDGVEVQKELESYS